jgi:hypothetical protein
MIGNVIGLVVLIFTPDGTLREFVPGYQDWMIFPLVAGMFLSIWFAYALLSFKRWAFLGLWAVGLAGVAFNIYMGIDFARATSGLLGLVILYWLLQIGGERSGWARLWRGSGKTRA